MSSLTSFLPGFPTSLFGRKKDSPAIQFRKRARRLVDQSPGELASELGDVIPAELVAASTTVQRRRCYSQEVTFWAFLSQILSEDGSCSRAVARIQSWCRDHGLPIPSADTSSYCKARQRLPMELLDAIQNRTKNTLDTQMPNELLWCGHVVKAIDGTSVQLPDTEVNQAEYPQSSNQKKGCGFPIMQLVGLTNLCHGGLEQFFTSDTNHHDHFVMAGMLPFIGKNEVAVTDRAFGSFEMFATLSRQGSWMVSRLHQARKVDWRTGKKIGPNQRIMTWKRPKRNPGSSLSIEEWEELPDEIQVRLIRFAVTGRDGKKKIMTLTTTLLDTEKYPSEDIEALYCQRWDIELRFRDLKTTMSMELLRTKTPEMARKEVAMYIIAYNALRVIMLKASIEHGSPLWRMSFKGALQVFETWGSQFRLLHHHPKKKNQLFDEMLKQISLRVVPHRPGRQEPRAIKRRPKSYQLLTAPRSEFREVQHRSSYRSGWSKKA